MFCQKCGAQIPDGSGFCSACGTPAPSAGAPVNSQQTGGSGFSAGPATAAPAAPNKFVTYLKDVWSYVTAFFRQDPSAAMNRAAHDTNPVWYGLLAAMWLLAFGMLMALIQATGNLGGNSSLNEHLASAREYDRSLPGSLLGAVGFFPALLWSLIIFVGSFMVKAVGTWVCAAKIAKINVKLPNVLNALTVAELPAVVIYVVATVLGFIWLPGALFLLVVASVMTYIMLYEVVKTTGMCGEKPTWMMTILVAIVALVSSLLLYWSLLAMYESYYYAIYPNAGNLETTIGHVLSLLLVD